MGKIAFWGMQHGLGVTSNTAAIATILAQQYQIRTLVSQPQWSDLTLEHAFKTALNKYNRESASNTGTGLDALERAVRSKKIDRDSVKNNSLLVEPDRLDFLQGSDKLDKLQFENSSDVLNIIYQRAKEYYDAVLLDVHSGSNSPVILELMRNSDLIVVCVNQNISVLDRYFKDRENWPSFLKDKPHLLLIGQYDTHSKYKAKNIANMYGYKGDILTIPYNTSFKDHYNDGDVKGFFSKNRYLNKKDENYFFIKEVERAAQTILTEIGINTELKHVERGAS